MKNAIIMVSCIEHLLDEVDREINQWVTDANGETRVNTVHNTNPVYMVRSNWGILYAAEIDSSLGCDVHWELKA